MQHFLATILYFSAVGCTSTYYVDLDPDGPARFFHRQQLAGVYAYLTCTHDSFTSTSDIDRLCQKMGRALNMLGARIGERPTINDPTLDVVTVEIDVRRLGSRYSSLMNLFSYATYYAIPMRKEDIFQIHISANRQQPSSDGVSQVATTSNTSRLAVRQITSLVYKTINAGLNVLRAQEDVLTPEISHLYYSQRIYQRLLSAVVDVSTRRRPQPSNGV